MKVIALLIICAAGVSLAQSTEEQVRWGVADALSDRDAMNDDDDLAFLLMMRNAGELKAAQDAAAIAATLSPQPQYVPPPPQQTAPIKDDELARAKAEIKKANPDFRDENSELSKTFEQVYDDLKAKSDPLLKTPPAYQLRVISAMAVRKVAAIRKTRKLESTKLALAMFPDAGREGSALNGRIQEVFARLKSDRDPILKSTSCPLVITEMAAAEIGIAPIHSP